MSIPEDDSALAQLAADLKRWGSALGFQQVGVTDTHLAADEAHLQRWLAAGYHGEMAYMACHGLKRSRPAELMPGTVRIISARMDYQSPVGQDPRQVLADPQLAYISRYALGRDYHKVLRQGLRQLAWRIESAIGPFRWRVFTDSAPVLEKVLAQKAGLGWIGKHSNLLDRQAGSWFFLGEIFVDIPLPVDAPGAGHCGRCQACLEACPTRAIVAPYQVDARRCLSYHTIELPGAIPLEFRRPLGNRIYGCDDCQLVCPWNRFARPTPAAEFLPRHGLDAARLIDLFAWSETEFLKRTEGSAIRRIGHQRWLRNIAVALGNAPPSPGAAAALNSRLAHPSELVREHVQWALAIQRGIRRESAP